MADAYELLRLICSGDSADAQAAMPKNKGQCIAVEFNVPPNPLKAGLVAGFQRQFCFYLDMRLALVGMEKHCILAYFRPEFYNASIRAYISDRVGAYDVRTIMERYQVSRIIAYDTVVAARHGQDPTLTSQGDVDYVTAS